MGQTLAKAGLPIEDDPRPDFRFFERSDNIVFALRGIPAHTLSSFGLHQDYHQPSDEIERIDFAHLAQVADVVARAARSWRTTGAPLDAGRPAGSPPRLMTGRDLAWILRRAVVGWWDDNVPRLGASLAYYTLFALAPILIVAISIAGFFFGAEAVQGEVTAQIHGLVGETGARAVQGMLEGAANRSGNGIATAIGLITFFLGSTGAFLELQTALNAIWRVKPKPDAGIKDMLLQRLLSFGLVIGVGFLLLVSLLVSAGLSALNRYIGTIVPDIAVIWQGVNVLVSLGVITMLFAMIYQFLPDVICGFATSGSAPWSPPGCSRWESF